MPHSLEEEHVPWPHSAEEGREVDEVGQEVAKENSQILTG